MTIELAAALEAAAAAADVLLARFGTPLIIERKGRIDLVSSADREAERAIRDVLDEAFPDDVVIGEEGDAACQSDPGTRRWFVDPLDGTTNFLRGRRDWCVSIALVDDDWLHTAVVQAPLIGETYSATNAGGATCNDRPLRVNSPLNLEDALVGSGFPYDFTGGSNLEQWAAVTLRALSVRSTGSAALSLCEVASGQLDAFWEQRLQPWDVAAGMLIAAEAGAQVTDLDGRPLTTPGPDVVVAPAALHDQLIALFSGLDMDTPRGAT